MHLKIPRLYDSHTHWLGTGQVNSGLKLFDLKSAAAISEIEILPSYFRGGWLVGFGWNDSQWAEPPTKEVLDTAFPEHPVFLSKHDGHSSWLNSLALEKLGFEKSHDGILEEAEHFTAYSSLPAYSDDQVYLALTCAMKSFNGAGFTHIRDLTCDAQQWSQAVKMDQEGKLTLYVEENFLCASPALLSRTLGEMQSARAQQTMHLKLQGIKVFFDGTLGSDTALLSKCNCSTTKFAWSLEDLESLFKETWSRGFEVSVHTIGDEAVHQVVTIARKVMSANQYTGWLNLEHVQVLRPETLQMMKALHVRCHMQPCHWLSDKVWLKEKLGELHQFAFPWGAISRSGILLFFGSDSPVAKSSLWDNERALRESKKAKIPPLKGTVLDFHQHPTATEKETFTVFEDQILKEIIFDGTPLTIS